MDGLLTMQTDSSELVVVFCNEPIGRLNLGLRNLENSRKFINSCFDCNWTRIMLNK